MHNNLIIISSCTYTIHTCAYFISKSIAKLYFEIKKLNNFKNEAKFAMSN